MKKVRGPREGGGETPGRRGVLVGQRGVRRGPERGWRRIRGECEGSDLDSCGPLNGVGVGTW